ncbi:MAG TPA: tetraacyldisaccharide 4'-kinase [Bryobacteraceae bacterium]|nr:tetraacyldisaccharide 4'-kinase [Bryobacteraceae bacterium]
MPVIFIYRFLQWAGFPLIVIYFLARGLREARYRRGFRERLGLLPWRTAPPGAVWVHAVSVGEVVSATGLLRALRAELPDAPLYVSVSTVAGRAVAEERLRGIAEGVFYAPIDYALFVRRVFRTLQPRAVVVLETEIWPNLWREAKRFGCALVVVNGRISDRALPRYRRLKAFFRPILGLADAILTQSEQDRARYQELGFETAVCAGNLKYDFAPAGAPPHVLRRVIEASRPVRVWVAASTMPPAQPGDPDEDEAVIAAFQKVARPGLLLILVPRKPERFDSAAALLTREGIPFLRRSALTGTETLDLPGAILLDSMGELSGVFALADIVFMGGTLAHRGGHNILEPAAYGKPVIAGPHMENFAEIAEKFTAARAVLRISSAAELPCALESLLNDPARDGIGERARLVAEAERGATARAAREIVARYWQAVPRRFSRARWLLAPLTRIWLLGGAWKRRRDVARQVRLGTPVVSVGGIAVGGAGKTPAVLWLAGQFDNVAVLTRGYRRKVKSDIILNLGAAAPTAETGDEAQIYLRARVGPVGIGADRGRVGREVEARFAPSLFLLDDGFQHARLHRDFDLVVLDGLDPFAGGAVIPLGRLREPVEAVRRADAVLVTRVSRADGVEAALRGAGYKGPVFTGRVVADKWVDSTTGEPAEVPERTGAFCGLGNPASFWATLRSAGVEPEFRRAFPDHHKYTREELEELGSGVDALLTTEKDAANLPGDWRGRALWLRIRLEVERGEELVGLIRERVRR